MWINIRGKIKMLFIMEIILKVNGKFGVLRNSKNLFCLVMLKMLIMFFILFFYRLI